jgi:hypothetical protein
MQHPQSVIDYFNRIGAVILNHRRAMVKIYKKHYYYEKALIKIDNEGNVTSSVEDCAPTAEEAAQMKRDLEGIEFPTTVEARSTLELRRQVKGELYEFFNRATGLISMVQERRILENGSKAYIPWVLLSDGEWASMEPDGDLPFWKPRATDGNTRIMIHEGAKAAKSVCEMLDAGGQDHPWAEELSVYEHWGMIGGALAPHRTKYAELSALNPSEVVYVCDNDYPGNSALKKVSKMWGRSLRGISFGNKFPPSWDMADPIPEGLFAPSGRYIGPSLKHLKRPATWATEVVPPVGKGRSTTIIKNDFAEEWLHCITPEVFIHRDWPNSLLNYGEFNNLVKPFSHVDDTARLLEKDAATKAGILKYMPGEKPGLHGSSYINTFQPSEIKIEPNVDQEPWLKFLEHLVPSKDDRHELMRWCATLIARPDIRMLYGVLLISETQGIGKGTLGEKILAPLVGETNTSYPSEQEIVESQFNYWLAHRRLAVVHEIYAGHSSKAYNKLKSAITDRYVTVQKKYQANYEIENWVHVFACSNSMRAMKLSMDDRRWFVPQLTEMKRDPEYWEGLNGWLTTEGGLGAIRFWAQEFLRKNKPVEKGAAAPWSVLKSRMIEESYSPGQMIAARVLSEIKEKVRTGELSKSKAFVIDTAIIDVIKHELYDGRHNDRLERPLTIRTLAKGMGWRSGDERAAVKDWGPSSNGGRVLALCPTLAGKNPADIHKEGLRPVELSNGARM